jgi:hypothetical protein
MGNNMFGLEGRLAALVGPAAAADPAGPRVDLFFLSAQEQARLGRLAGR